jgi:hypothetical protein
VGTKQISELLEGLEARFFSSYGGNTSANR